MKKVEISISSLVKAIVIIVIGLLLIVQTPTFATTGKSTASNVRVRKSPSTESEVIDLLGVDDIVEILGKEGDWYKVSFKGTTGYVIQSFISTNEKNASQNNNSKVEENQNNDNITNNDANTNNNETNIDITDNSNSQENNEVNNNVPSTTIVYKMAENSKVNILPVITAEQIGEVKKDEKVTLVINAKLWAYIKADNISGWVRIDKLSSEEIEVSDNENTQDNNDDNNNNVKDDSSKNEVEEDDKENNNNKEKQPETITFAPRTMYVGTTAINVRSESNTDSNVVDSLELNTEVKVVGEQNGWYKVEINGKNGFIRKDLLANNKKEVSSRNNQLDRNEALNNNQEQQSQQEKQTTVVTTVTESAPETYSESVPVSSSGVSGSDIAAYAQQFVGCRYVYGAEGPNSFDCSGLTKYVYAHFGYTLNRSSRDQAVQGVAVTGELQPGDILVFSNNGKNVGHVGIYIGNDKFVHASDSSTGVIISNLSDRWNKSKYWGARRIIQ